MAGQKYNKAYEAYQQAVYRDGRNPTFWCSIGVLYFQINQYRDALDAYSRAIRINPYISEVWFDLGSLYESCNNQISDAIDAYARAAELDPTDARSGQTDLPLLVPPQLVNRNSPGPFRRGRPPPVVLDDTCHILSHTLLAPIEVDRPPPMREHPDASPPPPGRDPRGPARQSILHHLTPQLQGPHEPFHHPTRVPSASASRVLHECVPQ